ncbi:hypothetical protein P872_18880 [Rhodonellum psychrophilum GCM71 = DSM 17998]|uniref:Hemerythrin-like domain-containing protein n=2 Tax=Rhodonellum TaxID=336827 RepID=U5BXF5_9BACT|nr:MULTISPECIES: DUF542 domain-containing protein [Rhodonellum]ERM82249.1 hypothetical protein P872_18880 [Rhodonellum psychrophilum GCM71 = DSM 17998]MDO9551368.1 DUF542 domain-containing protein [Rhodonellum sp.]SDZ25869.1 regulator of cell morphogenesis and NO signaling [Rhodonellum ikkaensis]
MVDFMQLTIGEIVANDYRAATIFKSFGIDFCCDGQRTIPEACASKQNDPELLISLLYGVLKTENHEPFDYNSWPIDLLADYIEKKHHRYTRERIPLLLKFFKKLSKTEAELYPEIQTIHELFKTSAEELLVSMKEEEAVLFPYIRKMIKSSDGKKKIGEQHLGIAEASIRKILQDHAQEAKIFRKIKALSNNFMAPEDASNSFNVAYTLLADFEKDLHKHFHLENNILFPKALEFEAGFQSTSK